MKPFDLTTARLRLERLGRAHIDDLVDLDSDPEVVRYVGGVSPTRAQYESEILARIVAYDDDPYGFLAAYEGSAFIGWFHLRPSVVDPKMLELGYRLKRAAWGRGIATEGSRAILRYAFEQLGEASVDACAVPDNVASTRVMVKCGMKRVGAFTHPRFDVVVDRYLVSRAEAIL
jgi:RimJ/RimL family protein N-acetyltransferase